MKKSILIFMILTLSLYGCNHNQNKPEHAVLEEKESQYKRVNVKWPVEFGLQEEVAMAESFIGFELYDGTMYLYAEDTDKAELGNYHVYEFSKETLNWEKTGVRWNELRDYDKSNNPFGRNGSKDENVVTYTSNIWHGPDGEVFFIVNLFDFKNMNRGHTFKLLRLKDGKASEIIMDGVCERMKSYTENGDESSLGWFVYGRRYLLFPYTDGSILAYDLVDDKGEVEWNAAANLAGLNLSSNGLYQVENNEVSILDFLTGEETGRLNCEGLDVGLDDPVGNTWAIYEGSEKTYYISRDGVFAWNVMDGEREQLVGSDGIGGGNNYIEAFFVDDDENVLIKYASNPAPIQDALESFGTFVVHVKE